MKISNIWISSSFAFISLAAIMLCIIPVSENCLDLLLCLNFVFSISVFFLVVSANSILHFSEFPTVILILTIFRFGLNIVSTKMIIANQSAGKMIYAVGKFIMNDSIAVGIAVFLIITAVNLFIITKGAGRVAEVSARFALESLAGKQMAVDASVNNGFFSLEAANKERIKVQSETNFYGAMDGASKFIKGDALVSCFIMFINVIFCVVGSFYNTGMINNVWNSNLNIIIGDALVNQIPALLISMGAGIFITKNSTTSVGVSICSQVLKYPKVILWAGCSVGLLAFMPNTPTTLVVSISLFFISLGIYLDGESKDKETITAASNSEDSIIRIVLSNINSNEGLLGSQLKTLKERIFAKTGLFISKINFLIDESCSDRWFLEIKKMKIFESSGDDIETIINKSERNILANISMLVTATDAYNIVSLIRVQDPVLVDELCPKKISYSSFGMIIKEILKRGYTIKNSLFILELINEYVKPREQFNVAEISNYICDKLILNGLYPMVLDDKTMNGLITLHPKVEETLSVSKDYMRISFANKLSEKLTSAINMVKHKGLRPIIVATKPAVVELKKIIGNQDLNISIFSYEEVRKDLLEDKEDVISEDVLF